MMVSLTSFDLEHRIAVPAASRGDAANKYRDTFLASGKGATVWANTKGLGRGFRRVTASAFVVAVDQDQAIDQVFTEAARCYGDLSVNRKIVPRKTRPLRERSAAS